MTQSASQPYPFYNTTYTLHRLTPLYLSTTRPIDTSVLQHHARRFREILIGDVLRGVRVGLETDILTTAGLFQKVTWRLLPDEDAWDALLAEDETSWNETTMTINHSRGIWICVVYERNTYTGLLLRGQQDGVIEGFQHFPLLMTRMPASLRDVLVEYLESNFDTRVSDLRLSSPQVTGAFEDYLRNVCLNDEGEEMNSAQRVRAIKSIVKETEVFIGFDVPSVSGALKTLEVHLTREDIPRLLNRGKTIEDSPLAQSPFIQALSIYLDGHLALNLKHERVRVVRIACGAFVLGIEGKVKLSEPLANELQDQQYRATRSLTDRLVNIALDGKLS